MQLWTSHSRCCSWSKAAKRHGRGDGTLQCKGAGDTEMLMVVTERARGTEMALGRTAEGQNLIFWLGTREGYNDRRYKGANGNRECRYRFVGIWLP